MSTDLESVISDAISDAELPQEPTSTDEGVEATSDPIGTTTDDTQTEDTPSQEDEPTDDVEASSEIQSPAAKAQAQNGNKAKDEFEKKFGIPKESASGRENRIPYSRVKKIVEKAERTLKDSHTKAYGELETKTKDYEGRLGKVAEFEHVMLNDSVKFLGMLSQLPAYKPFFDALQTAHSAQTAQAAGVHGQSAGDDMPAPDQKLPDGTMVYSMEGLKALLAWQGTNIESRVTKEVASRYAPIEQEWQAHRQLQAAIPQVQKQIDDARTWPLFNENEEGVVKALQSNPTLTLEGAYRQVVWPKMTSDRDTLRKQILAEIKRAPTSTAAPSGGAKGLKVQSGPRSLEDVIKDSIKELR